MKLKDLLHTAREKLTPRYGESESKWLVRTVIEHVKGWDPVEVALRGDDEVSDFIVGKVNDAVSKLLDDMPVQYILGDTYWYGMTLKVSPAVLIPRPETEELVDMIVKDNSHASDLKVLDVCTGSGCIAIALARNLPFSSVRAVDISDDALDIARQNAVQQKAKVDFYREDALSMISPGSIYDIIVSNPPYIVEKEKKEMSANVLDYEPHLALFVPDNDPLKFYKAISEYALDSLVQGGKLYFEINPMFASQLYAMLSLQKWNDIQLYPDIYGKKRFLRAVK